MNWAVLLISAALMMGASAAGVLSLELAWAQLRRPALKSLAVAISLTGTSALLLGWTLAKGGA